MKFVRTRPAAKSFFRQKQIGPRAFAASARALARRALPPTGRRLRRARFYKNR